MSRAAPSVHSPVNGLLSALPFVNSRSGPRLAKVIRRLFERGLILDENQSETVMLHLSTTKGPVLLEMMARVVGPESKPVVLMAGCEVETGLATLIVSESVISDENKRSYRDNEGTGNDTGGLPSLREPNDHAPSAPETESRDGGELRLLIEEAGCGLAHRTLPDEIYSCHSERQSIREIESDDDDSGDGESNRSSRRTSVSALTLPTVFRAPTRDA